MHILHGTFVLHPFFIFCPFLGGFVGLTIDMGYFARQAPLTPVCTRMQAASPSAPGLTL